MPRPYLSEASISQLGPTPDRQYQGRQWNLILQQISQN